MLVQIYLITRGCGVLTYTFLFRSLILEYGTYIYQQCMYDNIRVSPSSSFKMPPPHCLHCECIEQGLQFCGHGFSVGLLKPPEGYDACNLVFLNKKNPSEIASKQKTLIHVGK